VIRRAFTLVELLVVVGIIGVLVALLLPALRTVVDRARAVATTTTMRNFAKACDAYRAQFGDLPGAIPDPYLYQGDGDTYVPVLSGAQNALLGLMGGFRTPGDADYASYQGTEHTIAAPGQPPFRIKIDGNAMGEGPVRDGRRHDAFLTPGAREWNRSSGRVGSTAGVNPNLPDLIDAWGQPIIFLKRIRAIGPLVNRPGRPGQFPRTGLLPYTLSASLAELAQCQTVADPKRFSVLNTESAGGRSGAEARDLTLGQLIRHAGTGTITATGASSDLERIWSGTARGDYFVMSAGPDGIYFSAAQGNGSASAPQGDIVSATANPDGPRVLERFDDIVIAGGG
jgi:prepilin-type N-terminal cleavage/methylation domain-containing protein